MEAFRIKTTAHAMDFQLESNHSTPYVSAPTSPSRLSFYSAPGSPTKGVTASPYAWESKHGLIKGTTTDTDSDDFEFTTSQKFRKPMYQQHHRRRRPHPQQQQQQKVEQLPDMSYADELFSSGEVVPLKPPPRLQHTINRSSNRQIQYYSGHFQDRGLRPRKDFDPFMVALENVKKDETRKKQWIPYQRSQSFSLLRSTLRDDPTGRVQVQHQNNKVGHPEAPIGRLVSLPKGSIKPMRSASERFIGDMRLDPDSPYNSTLTTPAETAKDTGGPSTKVTRRWRSFPKGSKRRIIRDFLLRSASQGKADPKDKLRNNTAALKVTEDKKDPSFYPMQETHDNEKKSTTGS
ncbi:hypothetical protein CKAN_00836700 [Cinnamomum micranthum f. kanehirae]|uniref:Uncharacterized protein n=1 Tax=Cinnamomum micranthum f. kanehirae TaxID=337451 RepID=A0A443NMI8_9MAGN|nr:hypothetical protein CKAN_00836700 [Cinnamomum micranthum f. kanehirae]